MFSVNDCTITVDGRKRKNYFRDSVGTKFDSQ